MSGICFKVMQDEAGEHMRIQMEQNQSGRVGDE